MTTEILVNIGSGNGLLPSIPYFDADVITYPCWRLYADLANFY